MFHFYLIKAYDFIYHGILLAEVVSYGIGQQTSQFIPTVLKKLSRNKQE
jgi:hypothetical protein